MTLVAHLTSCEFVWAKENTTKHEMRGKKTVSATDIEQNQNNKFFPMLFVGTLAVVGIHIYETRKKEEILLANSVWVNGKKYIFIYSANGKSSLNIRFCIVRVSYPSGGVVLHQHFAFFSRSLCEFQIKNLSMFSPTKLKQQRRPNKK